MRAFAPTAEKKGDGNGVGSYAFAKRVMTEGRCASNRSRDDVRERAEGGRRDES